MKNLTTIFADFLNDKPLKAGNKNREVTTPPPEPTITPEQKDRLLKNLLTQSRNNGYLIFAMSSLLLILFGVCIYFAIYFRDTPDKLKLTIGGSLLSLVVIAKLLFEIWKEKSKMDLLITLVPEIAPEEAKEVIEILYYKRKDRK